MLREWNKFEWNLFLSVCLSCVSDSFSYSSKELSLFEERASSTLEILAQGLEQFL